MVMWETREKALQMIGATSMSEPLSRTTVLKSMLGKPRMWSIKRTVTCNMVGLFLHVGEVMNTNGQGPEEQLSTEMTLTVG